MITGKLRIIHRTTSNPGSIAKLGPYGIETFIPVKHEGAATAYRVAVAPHQQTNTSYHRIAEELYCVLAGNGIAYLDGVPYRLQTGDFLRLPPGVKHRFETGSESLVMLDVHVPGCRPDRDTYFVDETPEGFTGAPLPADGATGST